MRLTKVVLFEDDPLVAELLGEGLLDHGCGTVHVAITAEEAIARLTDAPLPDFAVLDLWTPNFGRYLVAETALAQHVPFMFLTGDHRAAEVLQEAGFPVLRKPCDPGQIIEYIATAIQRGTALAGAEIPTTTERLRKAIEDCRRARFSG